MPTHCIGKGYVEKERIRKATRKQRKEEKKPHAKFATFLEHTDETVTALDTADTQAQSVLESWDAGMNTIGLMLLSFFAGAIVGLAIVRRK